MEKVNDITEPTVDIDLRKTKSNNDSNDHAVKRGKSFKTLPIPSKSDVESVVDLLMANKAAYARAFLASKNLRVGGTREQLKDRIISGVAGKLIAVEELLDQLTEIEGWGRQHGYLFSAPEKTIEFWKNESFVRKLLNQNRTLELLNTKRAVFLPKVPTLISIELSPKRLRLLWANQRTWEERLESGDKFQEGIIYRASVTRIARAVSWFEIDLVSGLSVLMIQQLPSGSNYLRARDELVRALKPMIDLESFEAIRLSSAIASIASSGEVKSRQVSSKTNRGLNANFSSPSRKHDVFAEPGVVEARKILGINSERLGNFYLIESEPVKRAIHFKLYAEDQRFAIFGQCSEEEVRYVLGRIRFHCN